MNEKPILFSTEMVQAIMDGRKTQTRRIVKVNQSRAAANEIERFGKEWTAESEKRWVKKSPYGLAGDQLWVRETWATLKGFDDLAPSKIPHGGERWPATYMKAWTGAARDSKNRGKWRPSIFMPRWASQTNLLITRLRVDELQNISEDDAHAEGIPRRNGPYILDFAKLWDQINAERGYSWASNPLVWVVDFEVMK